MKTWKTPNRPTHEITASFNDGIVNVFSVTDVAESGHKPVKRLTPVYSLHFAERKLGIQRYYSGKQNQIEITRVLRVPEPPEEITNQDIAIVEHKQYRIDLVQMVRDSYPPSLDLTLERIAQSEEYAL